MKRYKVENIVLYHGTDTEFKSFDFSYARSFKDFGKGFYLTTNYQQAQKWAQNKAIHRKNEQAYIYEYSVSENLDKSFRILELLKYDKTWIDFIIKCRLEGLETEYDIIYDRIADNQYKEISAVLWKYSQNQIDVETALEKIKWNQSADQYCFKTDKALKILKRTRKIIQYRDDSGIWKQVVEKDDNTK